MVNIKSFLIGLIAGFIFSLAFTALFAAVVLFLLPEQMTKLEKIFNEILIPKLLNSLFNSQLIESTVKLPFDISSTESFESWMKGIKEMCLLDKNSFDPPFNMLCDELNKGKINTPENFRAWLFQIILKPQIEKEALSSFRYLKDITDRLHKNSDMVMFSFVIMYAVASAILFLDSLSISKTLHSVIAYSMSFSFFQLVGLIIIWVSLPSLVSYSVEKELQQLLKGVDPATAKISGEIATQTAAALIPWIREFLFQISIFFAALTVFFFILKFIFKKH